ncbi:hypothetical protein [uncultured Mameliella sp.]|uniref:hypothetical protein n=1 Tax=uncultured Mameliella sp. TaxID=1447087 RepID=UPI002626A379|nr:hypothetical protein [uncultured Mameliella sp.]
MDHIHDTAEIAPDTAPDGLAVARTQIESGLNFLFLAAFPLLLWVFQDSFAGIATAIALLWVYSLALRLIAAGQQIHHDYDHADVARAPRVPRKVIGAILIGLVVLVLAGHKYDNLWIPGLTGVLATGLALAAFGPDPMRDKGSERARRQATLDSVETSLASLTDRVAALDDATLTLKVEAARRLVLGPMRRVSGNPGTVERLDRPARRVVEIMEHEIDRLEAAWNAQGHVFARRRFLAKLDVMTDSFETFAMQNGIRGSRDAFERQADKLIDRMPRESAA